MNEGIYCMIDCGSVLFINAYRFKDSDNVDEVLKGLDDYIRTLLDNTACTYYAGFIDGSRETFRTKIAVTKPYKGNRPPTPEWFTKWSGPMKAYLRDEWNFQVVNGIEADDAVCIYQTWCRENNKNSIMCHGDKDLYQIEGNHYDIRKHTRKYVSEEEGCRNLYTQILCGDASDNITGCKSVGKVGASRILLNDSEAIGMSLSVNAKFISIYGVEEGNKLYREMDSLCRLLTSSNSLDITWSEYKRESVLEEPEIDLTGLIWD